jgi:hypothetical protein
MLNSSRRNDANKVFLVRYSHNGSQWVLELPASDQVDAQARLDKLSQAELLGERAGCIPADDAVSQHALRLWAE